MEIETKHTVGAFVALLVLTGVAVLVPMLPLGGWGSALSLVVAAAKALLVMGVFMRLLEAPVSPRLAFATAIAMFCLLVFFVAFDVQTRHSPGLVPPDARPMAPGVGPEAERASDESRRDGATEGDQPVGSG